MGSEIAVSGVAISIIFAFIRWAIPAMPKPIAWSGVTAGVVVLMTAWAMPQMNITLPIIALFLFGAMCIGGAVHLAMKPKTSNQGPAPTASGNTMGNVDGNSGIITQGQKGDNSVGRR